MTDPPKFYKYTTVANAADIFTRDKVRFACPAVFNDLFEFEVNFVNDTDEREKWVGKLAQVSSRQDPAISPEEAQKRATKTHQQIASDWSFSKSILDQQQSLGKSNSGVLALSEIWHDTLMWAHYADNHKGICIEFDVPRLKASLVPPAVLGYVAYQSDLPQLSFIKSDSKELFEKTALTKSDHWKHEQEWRFIIYSEDKENPGWGWREISEDAVVGVIFGVRTPKSEKERIFDWIKRRKNLITIYQAEKRPDTYSLRIGRCELS